MIVIEMLIFWWPLFQAPGVIGSVLGLACPVLPILGFSGIVWWSQQHASVSQGQTCLDLR